MQNFKDYIDKNILNLIEKTGQLINPLILKLTDKNSHLLIYYFHGIYETEKQKELNHVDPQNNITVQQFITFIDYFLSNNYHFVNPDDILKGLPPNKRYILLTFDDGYFNNTLAIEILNKYKIPATFFVTTKNILKQESFWWDVIFKYRVKQSISLKKIRDEQSHLKKFKYDYIYNYIVENFGLNATKPWSDIDRPLKIEELNNISKNPLVIIGNHTHDHTILTIYNTKEIESQLRESNKVLSKIIGYEPKLIAFPNGNFSPKILEICKNEGFDITFNTVKQRNQLPLLKDNSVLNLNRFMTQTIDIKTYGNFDRLGYSSKSLYLNLKRSINMFK